MKAIRFYAKEDVRVDNVASPAVVGDSQVLVQPLTCGICGTDLHEFAGGPIVTPSTPHKFTGATLPQILGHEFSAEVLEIGRSVTRVRKGDRVSIQPLVMPLDDYYSRRGLNHLSPSMGCVGLSWAWGGMGELAVINDYNANPIPDNVPDEQGAMAEPTAAPPVSISVMRCLSQRADVTMRSRVVPGRSKTSEISRPARQLKSADLPTFGRPTIATICSINFYLLAKAADVCPLCFSKLSPART